MAALFDLSGIAGILSAGGDAAVKLRTAITGQDPAQDLKKLEDELNALQASDAGQTDINVEEAKSSNLFVSGWRPAVGWVCVLGVFWVVVGYPISTWACALWAPTIVVPAVDGNMVMSLLFGLLGLTAARTVEKIRGVASK